MKITKTIKLIWSSVILPACGIYTILTLVTNFFMTAISTAVEKPAIPLSSCLMFLAMSLCITASTLFFRIRKLPLYLQIICNFFSTLISIIAVLTFGTYELDADSLVLIVVFVFLYIIIATPAIIIKTRINRKREEETEYSSMFSEK